MTRLSATDATWLADTVARNRTLYGSLRMEAGADGGGTGEGGEGAEGGEGKEPGFSQADVDRIVADRLKRERDTIQKKYADYDDLKKKAAGSATVEQQLATLQTELESTKREALKRRVQAAHGISDEDADLFLTGSDEESLTAQAKRLAEREAERKAKGNRVPGEGRTPTKPGDDPMRSFTRNLFGREE